jgi:hypothetical protein
MIRSLLLASVVSAAAAAAFASACSSTSETCVSGPCGLGGASSSAGTGSATSSSGTTGTGGSDPDAGACSQTPQTGDFPCDVFAVIHARCNPCHQQPPQNGAPFPLLTYADTQQVYTPSVGLVFQQMFISIGPNGAPRMPFGGPYLDATEYATLHDWLGQCAPPVPTGTGCGCPGTGCDGGQ